MNDLESGLLEAVPADAGRILVVGPDLLRHRRLWEMRNPQAVIEFEAAHDTAGAKIDAALLSLDALGEDAAPLVARVADGLAPGGTLALFAAASDKAAQIAVLTERLQQRGLVVDRTIGGKSADEPGMLRFQLPPAAVAPRLRITAIPFSFNPDPVRQSVVRVRLREPLEQLSSFPRVACVVRGGPGIPRASDPDAANILITQRYLYEDPDDVFSAIGSQNYISIGEFDDDPGRGEKIGPGLIKANLIRHHAVQTSSPELADYLRTFNPEIGLFPNQLPRVRPFAPRQPGGTVRILFAAINREAGWRGIINAYRATVATYGERVETVVVGDRKFFDELQPLNSRFRPTIPYADYLEELGKSDIALLPLSKEEYDRRKTDLKFVECAEAGTVTLASNTLYGATVRSGKTGFLYRNTDEFKRYLRILIDDPAKRAGIAEQAYGYVSQQRILATQVRRQYEWYLSLVERRAELERAIKDRVGAAGAAG